MNPETRDIPTDVGLESDAAAKKLKRWQIFTLILVYGMSLCILISRRSVSIVLPAIREDPNVGLTTHDAGLLLAVAAGAAIMGNLVSGVTVSRLGGKIPLVIIGWICAVAVAVFGLMRSLPMFMLALFPMRAVMSANTPSQVNLISMWFTPAMYGRAWGIVSSSSRIGAASAGLLLGMMESVGLSWMQVLFIAGGILATMTLLATIFLKRSPESIGLHLHGQAQKTELKRRSIRQMFLVYVREPRLWLMCFGCFMSTFCFEFDQFVPLFLNEVYDLTPGHSSMASAVFPAGMAISLMTAGFLMDKITRKHRAMVLVGMMFCTLLCIVSLWLLIIFQWGNVGFAIPLVFLYGALLGPPSYLPQSFFALHYGGPAECSVIYALLELFMFCAQIVFDLIRSALPNWSSVFLCLCVAGLLATTLYSLFFVLDLHAERTSQLKNAVILQDEEMLISETEKEEMRTLENETQNQ